MIALGLCQANYQILFIIYLKFTAKSVEGVKKKKKKIKPVCDFIVLKNNKLHHKWNECKKGWSTTLGGLIKIFPNTYKFCNNDINKSILLLRKGVYLYE